MDEVTRGMNSQRWVMGDDLTMEVVQLKDHEMKMLRVIADQGTIHRGTIRQEQDILEYDLAAARTGGPS